MVDNDKDAYTVIKIGLEHVGFEVHGFTDPIEALAHMEKGCNTCKLLVTDIRMPNMTGFELVRRVKKLRPEMKIVMMTAFEVNLSELQDVLPSMPVDNLIRKPFMPSKLVEVIKSILSS